jgi:hypothetical protein
MKFKVLTILGAPGFVIVAAPAAASGRSGELHVTKECLPPIGLAGSFCTITSSSLADIKVNSKVFYDQAAGFSLEDDR